MFRKLKRTFNIGYDALKHFNQDDGWAISSHLALSILMALFPFLIFATALASMMGTAEQADIAVQFLFDRLPIEIAAPIAKQVTNVLTQPRGDFLTLGVLIALFLASNGVESFRVALNRAYRVPEKRSIIMRRLQGLLFVLLGAIGLLALAILLVITPIVWTIALQHFPQWIAYDGTIFFGRVLLALGIFGIILFSTHILLPQSKNTFADVWPGIVFTIVFWMLGASVFSTYLKYFANYASTYAGLAGVMIAIIFLYIISVIFILGGEINAAIARNREDQN